MNAAAATHDPKAKPPAPPAPAAKPPGAPAAAAPQANTPPPSGSPKILRSLDDYEIKHAPTLPESTRESTKDKPLDENFTKLAERCVKHLADGEPGQVEWFVPKWFFEDRRRDPTTVVTDMKMRDAVKTWFKRWQKDGAGKRDNYDLKAYYRDSSKPGATHKEDGVSVFMTLRAR